MRRPLEPEKDKKTLLPIEEMEMECGSDTDMTGLIAANPGDPAEMESYMEVYPYLPPILDPDQM